MARGPLDKDWKIHEICGLALFVSFFFWAPVTYWLHRDSDVFSLALITTVTVLGVYFFARGLAVYREFRVLLGTPETPIRSLAMGFVEVHGKATGAQTVTSPVGKTPCFYYNVILKARGPGSPWNRRTYRWTDQGGTSFYLEDATAKVRVNSDGMETDLLVNKETKRHKSPELSYLDAALQRASYALVGKSPPPVPPPDELINYAEEVIHAGLLKLHHRAMGKTHVNYAEEVKHTGFLVSCRFWEYCVLPGHWYDLAGTCVENPEPKDEHDRNIIVKGSNEPTFLISWRSEKGIKARLRRRAGLDTAVGGLLILLGAAAGLSLLGLL
jgi:hypothetical protein